MADLADAAGRVVAVPIAVLARVRRAKPMHPRGVVFSARLVRHGLDTGVTWLDTAGTDDALVRISRGAGLPPPFPDLLGFALRVPGERPVDLLLSSTGTGRWTRRVPVFRQDAATSYGSIMAYRGDVGPVWLSAVPQAAGLPADSRHLATRGPGAVVELSVAVGTGPWRRFATVTLGHPADPTDPPVHFDAVLNAPPGLSADGPLARFREPAYAAARAARGASPEAPDR
jgi:hypothetical protein